MLVLRSTAEHSTEAKRERIMASNVPSTGARLPAFAKHGGPARTPPLDWGWLDFVFKDQTR